MRKAIQKAVIHVLAILVFGRAHGLNLPSLIADLRTKQAALMRIPFKWTIERTHRRTFFGKDSQSTEVADNPADRCEIWVSGNKTGFRILSGPIAGSAGFWTGKAGCIRERNVGRQGWEVVPWLQDPWRFPAEIQNPIQIAGMLSDLSLDDRTTFTWLADALDRRNSVVKRAGNLIKLAWMSSDDGRSHSYQLDISPSKDYSISYAATLLGERSGGSAILLTSKATDWMKLHGVWLPLRFETTEKIFARGRVASLIQETDQVVGSKSEAISSREMDVLALAKPGDLVQTAAGSFIVSPSGKWISNKPIIPSDLQPAKLLERIGLLVIFIIVVASAVGKWFGVKHKKL